MSKPELDPNPWKHFHEAFSHFDKGWRSAEAGWDQVGKQPKSKPGDAKVHTVTASTWRRRWKMFRMFQYLAWKLLWQGEVTIKL